MKPIPSRSTKNRLSFEPGFTLLELLVVVAIIGILSSLLLAAISNSKRKGQQIKCVGNLRQLGIGIQNFVTDNHAYPSPLGSPSSGYPGLWLDQIEREGFGNPSPKTAFFTEGVWRCPSGQWGGSWGPGNYPVSYSYNTFGVPAPVVWNIDPSLGLAGHFISATERAPLAESEVVNPSEMMAIGESFSGGIDFMRISLAYPPARSHATSRHQGRVNVLFCDGHVESPKLEYVFEDKSDAALSRWNRDHQPHPDKL